MSDEINEGKIIVFSPTGFILKMLFSIGMSVLLSSSYRNSKYVNSTFLQKTLLVVTTFVVCWFAASMFGFCLRATGNYIIAVILMVFLVALLCAVLTWVCGKSELLGNTVGIAFILFLIWLPIKDIRKAIYYFKNTI